MEELITKFLDVNMSNDGYVNKERRGSWVYETPELKYEFVIDRKAKSICISADPDAPFSGMSLFEVCVLFDRISIETEPQFYGDQEILVFRKDYENDPNYKVLMVMRWESNKLSIWPNNYEANLASLEHWDE